MAVINGYTLLETPVSKDVAVVYKGKKENSLHFFTLIPTRAAADSSRILTELLNEKEAQSALNPDHIIKMLEVYPWQDDKGRNFVVVETEGFNGRMLEEHVKQHAPEGLDDKIVRKIMLQMISAMKCARKLKLLHLAIAPGHIFRTQEGVYKLMHFGLARVIGICGDEIVGIESDTWKSDDGKYLLRSTLPYASPERLNGGHVTYFSEIYSLGKLMHFLCTGSSDPAVSVKTSFYAEIIQKCTALNPKDRFHTYSELKNEIDVHFMKECASCGKLILKTAKVCRFCGAEQSVEPELPPQPPVIDQEETVDNEEPPVPPIPPVSSNPPAPSAPPKPAVQEEVAGDVDTSDEETVVNEEPPAPPVPPIPPVSSNPPAPSAPPKPAVQEEVANDVDTSDEETVVNEEPLVSSNPPAPSAPPKPAVQEEIASDVDTSDEETVVNEEPPVSSNPPVPSAPPKPAVQEEVASDVDTPDEDTVVNEEPPVSSNPPVPSAPPKPVVQEEISSDEDTSDEDTVVNEEPPVSSNPPAPSAPPKPAVQEEVASDVDTSDEETVLNETSPVPPRVEEEKASAPGESSMADTGEEDKRTVVTPSSAMTAEAKPMHHGENETAETPQDECTLLNAHEPDIPPTPPAPASHPEVEKQQVNPYQRPSASPSIRRAADGGIILGEDYVPQSEPEVAPSPVLKEPKLERKSAPQGGKEEKRASGHGYLYGIIFFLLGVILSLLVYFLFIRPSDSSPVIIPDEEDEVVEKDTAAQVETEEWQPDPSFAGEEDFAWLSKELNPFYLENLSADELALLRHTIYARHGYIFDKKELNDYFSHYSWYRPKFRNVDNKLTKIEKKNLRLIRQYEEKQ